MSIKKKDRRSFKEWMSHQVSVRYTYIAAFIIVVVILLSLYGYLKIKNYEDSVLSMYAEQQDAYVQLVLDQINIQGEKSDEKIISDILSSLDSSAQKYWTLSKNQSLIFVKNVTETKRYRGFTTATYYVSDEARHFIENMGKDRVKHQIVEMENEKYVISGVTFKYNNANYKICLLTGEGVILDQNDFMSAQISLYSYVIVLLVILLVAVMVVSKIAHTKAGEAKNLSKKIVSQNRAIEELERELRLSNAYDSKWNLYVADMLDVFLEKLAIRDVKPITFARICFLKKQDMVDFLENSQMFLDERVLRFKENDNYLVLLLVSFSEEESRRILLDNIKEPAKLESCICSKESGMALYETYDKFGKIDINRKSDMNKKM